MKAINVTQNKTLASSLSVADTFLGSLLGLMGRRHFPMGAGLWINPCQSVHSMWMRFPIDVIFLDKQKSIVHLITNMKPFRISRHISRAKSVLELPASTIIETQTQLGDQVEITEGQSKRLWD
jgi:uncharacterized membrane protein (UPF0127 family)